jgi:hypothetical protein
VPFYPPVIEKRATTCCDVNANVIDKIKAHGSGRKVKILYILDIFNHRVISCPVSLALGFA